jgi:hypothetical protein
MPAAPAAAGGLHPRSNGGLGGGRAPLPRAASRAPASTYASTLDRRPSAQLGRTGLRSALSAVAADTTYTLGTSRRTRRCTVGPMRVEPCGQSASPPAAPPERRLDGGSPRRRPGPSCGDASPDPPQGRARARAARRGGHVITCRDAASRGQLPARLRACRRSRGSTVDTRIPWGRVAGLAAALSDPCGPTAADPRARSPGSCKRLTCSARRGLSKFSPIQCRPSSNRASPASPPLRRASPHASAWRVRGTRLKSRLGMALYVTTA